VRRRKISEEKDEKGRGRKQIRRGGGILSKSCNLLPVLFKKPALHECQLFPDGAGQKRLRKY
jgi:hypothetical protein